MQFGFVILTTTKIAGMYKIDRSKISVSGISSGGGMATQMHVAYSSVFMGVGVLSACKHILVHNAML